MAIEAVWILNIIVGVPVQGEHGMGFWTAIRHISSLCPSIVQVSLLRFFDGHMTEQVCPPDSSIKSEMKNWTCTQESKSKNKNLLWSSHQHYWGQRITFSKVTLCHNSHLTWKFVEIVVGYYIQCSFLLLYSIHTSLTWAIRPVVILMCKYVIHF